MKQKQTRELGWAVFFFKVNLLTCFNVSSVCKVTFELVLPFPNCLLTFRITRKLFVGKFPQENVIGPLLFF